MSEALHSFCANCHSWGRTSQRDWCDDCENIRAAVLREVAEAVREASKNFLWLNPVERNECAKVVFALFDEGGKFYVEKAE